MNEDSSKPEESLHLFKLKQSAVSPTLSTQLRLFLSSILISAHMSLSQASLRVDQLSPPGPLLPNQRQRLELARRLLVGVEVAGLLNDAHLCLQVVVKCYGLVSPLIQLRVPSRLLVEMILYCFTVLVELPEPLLNTRSPVVTAALHHMVAVLAYYVGKVRNYPEKEYEKNCFSIFSSRCFSCGTRRLCSAVSRRVPSRCCC